ncbi:MAG: MopE-related protein, partial [Myxococcota bacterium]|nr:MopE-related protein [Myxococcota bacterium]
MKSATLLMLLPGCVLISDEEYEWRTRAGGGMGAGGGDCDLVTFWADADGDGFGDPQGAVQACPDAQPDATVDNYDDCNDQDPTVGLVKDWYIDGDGDGHGAAGSDPVPACAQPAGYVARAGDCDDASADVNPDAVEVCNEGVDDDCNGDADDADAGLDVATQGIWWTDADGDGFGDPDGAVRACAQPAGAVDDATDCVDSDPEVSPGLAEVCGDRKDNDCDGTDNGCVPTGLESLVASAIGVTGLATADDLGTGLAVGDMNGDGTPDLLLGAPRADGGGQSAGEVRVMAGPVVATTSADAALATLTGTAGEQAGRVVRSGSDLDGDGYDDMLVGAPYARTRGTLAGAVWMVDGPVSGALQLDAGVLLEGVGGTDRAGIGLDLAGDVDGDGAGDFLVGALGEATGGGAAGAAYLVLGPVTADLGLEFADARVTGGAGDRVGAIVAGAGDLDGDGLSDLAITADRADLGAADGGVVYVLSGPISGDAVLADVGTPLSGSAANQAAGTGLAAAGDVDGDGFADLLVGAPGRPDAGFVGAGAVYLIPGPVTAAADLGTQGVQLRGAVDADRFG